MHRPWVGCRMSHWATAMSIRKRRRSAGSSERMMMSIDADVTSGCGRYRQLRWTHYRARRWEFRFFWSTEARPHCNPPFSVQKGNTWNLKWKKGKKSMKFLRQKKSNESKFLQKSERYFGPPHLLRNTFAFQRPCLPAYCVSFFLFPTEQQKKKSKRQIPEKTWTEHKNFRFTFYIDQNSISIWASSGWASWLLRAIFYILLNSWMFHQKNLNNN